jgi:hypothetical protein
MNPVHTFPSWFFHIYSNNILQSTSRFSKRSLPFRFSNKNTACISHLSNSRYMSRPSHPPWSDHSVKSTNYEAPHYAVFSSHLSLALSWVKVSSSAPCCHVPSIHVLPLRKIIMFLCSSFRTVNKRLMILVCSTVLWINSVSNTIYVPMSYSNCPTDYLSTTGFMTILCSSSNTCT